MDGAFRGMVRSVATAMGKWVLAVDDDEDLRSFTVEMLQRAGYTATAALRGAASVSTMGELSLIHI